jgi:thiol-disulfide isomerase/thioredoxin
MESLKAATLFSIALFVLCSLWPPSVSALPQEHTSAAESSPQSEERTLTIADSLMAAGDTDGALAALDEAIRQSSQSIVLVRKKYDVLFAAKRFEECLQLLNGVYPLVPPDVQRIVLAGKRFVLYELVRQDVAACDTEKALMRLHELADAGYRGLFDLDHDKTFKSLWKLPKYREMRKQIEANAGIGRPAVDFSAILMNGDAYRLSERRGKVVLVDFWSTSCVPCRKELPNLRELQAAHSRKGFEIVSINLDTDKAVLERYLKENPTPGEIVFSGKGFDDDIAQLYEVSWVPSYWLVDRAGVLRYFDVRGKDLASAVKQLIKEI